MARIQHLKIKRLPRKLRAELDRRILSGADSLSDLELWLSLEGEHISRTTIGRYSQVLLSNVSITTAIMELQDVSGLGVDELMLSLADAEQALTLLTERKAEIMRELTDQLSQQLGRAKT